MKRLDVLAALLLALWPLAAAQAGDAGAAALDQIKARAMRPVPKLPPPAGPKEVWVPERRVWVPGLGVYATVPGHWERQITDTQSSVPPLTIFREGDRMPLAVPPGERPPADLRPGP